MTLDYPPHVIKLSSANHTAALKRSLAIISVSFLLSAFSIGISVSLIVRSPWGFLATAGVLLLIAASLAASITLARRNHAVFFGNGDYVVRTALGRERRFTARDVDRVITTDAYRLAPLAPVYAHLHAVGPTGRVLYLGAQNWDVGDMGRLAMDLAGRGVALHSIPWEISPSQLRAMDKPLVTWIEANRIAFSLIVAGGTLLLAVIVVVAIVTIAFASR